MIKEMDARKVNMYALSMTNPMVYWAPPAFALKLSQAANNAGSAAHLKYPDRFVSTIMLPMQDPKLAVQELERAAKLPGLRALNIGEHINGKNLHEKEFWPIYERAEALGLLLHGEGEVEAVHAFREARVVLDVAGGGDLPADDVAFEDDGAALGAGGIDGGGVAGRTGTKDQQGNMAGGGRHDSS